MMKKPVQLAIGLLLLVGAAFGATGCQAPNSVTINEQKTESLEGIQKVQLIAGDSNIRVTYTEGNDAQLRVHGTMSETSSKYELKTERQGDTLIARYERASNNVIDSIGFFDHEVQFDIALPKRVYQQVRIETALGMIDVPALEAQQVSLQAESGSIQAEAIKAKEAKVRTNLGTIKIDRLLADRTEVNSESGDVTIREVQAADAKVTTNLGVITLDQIGGGLMNIQTESGDINATVTRVEKDIKFRTNLGQVKLFFLEPPQSAKVDLSTNNGTITSDLTGLAELIRAADTEVKGNMGTGGGPRIEVRTESGSIALQQK